MKAHLVQIADGTLKSGEALTVTCGLEIESAQIVGCWDTAEELRKVDLDQVRGLCGKCRKKYQALEGRSLLYAVREGDLEL